MLGDKLLAQRDHVLRLVAEKADGLDVLAHRVLAERQHFPGRVSDGEERACGLVHAGVCCLRREHDGNQQREDVDVLKLALRLRIGSLETGKDRRDLLW